MEDLWPGKSEDFSQEKKEKRRSGPSQHFFLWERAKIERGRHVRLILARCRLVEEETSTRSELQRRDGSVVVSEAAPSSAVYLSIMTPLDAARRATADVCRTRAALSMLRAGPTWQKQKEGDVRSRMKLAAW